MRISFFGVACATLFVIANGKDLSKIMSNPELNALFDAGYSTPHLGCEILGLVYCCMILTGYQKVTENALVTKAYSLKEEAEKQGLNFDELVEKATKPLTDSVAGLGIGIITDNLGFNDLFHMVAKGDMSKDDIARAMYDKIQNSGLKREYVNKAIQEKCPNWQYPSDHSGIHHMDKNGVANHLVNGKPQIDCDALDFFYCCLTSNTLLRSSEASQTKMFIQLKKKAEKNGQSIGDLLSSAMNEFSPKFKKYILLDWMNDSTLTDKQMLDKVVTEVNNVGSKADKIRLKMLLEQKCFNKLGDTPGKQ